MESLDYWRLCDELSIIQAALLFFGIDPSGENGDGENLEMYERPHGYEAVMTGITSALRQGTINGRLILNQEFDIRSISGYKDIEDSIDVTRSRVDVESLRKWLTTRGIRTGFFFQTATDTTPNYLDPKNPRYAPKLAAAVQAWQEVTDPGKTSAKQALEKWLREHAAEFGLTDNDGYPISAAIEECSKVANWNLKGGAPKTPSK